MAIKKSQLYSSLWSSCDELRGGMDASQYKDYVLTLLFMKYVTDKYAGKPNAIIEVPEGGSFTDMVKLKGKKEIGDEINKIIGRFAEVNDLKEVLKEADFNNEDKLGRGKEMQDRLSKLIAIFQELDLRANRAEGDDLLGDAYEYLMRHFATESGKSKGQFYTPAEVSRIMAKVIGIDRASGMNEPTVYDPTCGSGSLLIKAADEAGTTRIAIYGQEMDNANWALARMNMILHSHPSAEVWHDNTLAAPYFKNPDGSLQTFDFAVANPPFSTKSWFNGLDPANDEFGRFEFGIPPTKNGDYAFLLHLIKSLKSKGKGAIILPHGILFRGGKEADIRRNLIKHGLIKGIIGLPANLFYGTGIPACILAIDKENAHDRTGVFMIDASRGFVKDGNKNRLRAQDMHKIVDAFDRQTELPGYSRMVPVAEIANQANDYNLNIPRYIDSSEPEDLHDLDAHLNGGIPDRNIDALNAYWTVFPSLRDLLFKPGGREGYSEARIPIQQIKATILGHEEFKAYADRVTAIFNMWQENHEQLLRGLKIDDKPKEIIHALSEDMLECFEELPLLDRYDIYQRLMAYWVDVMQDDVYTIAGDGWEVGRILRPAVDKEPPDFLVKKGQKTLKYVGEVIPASLVIAKFFDKENLNLEQLEAAVAEATQRKEEYEEEYGGDEGVLNGLEGKSGIAKSNVQNRAIQIKEAILKEFQADTLEHNQAMEIKKTTFGTKPWTKGIKDDEGLFEELDILCDYLRLVDEESAKKKVFKEALDSLHKSVIEKYPSLNEVEIKALVVHDKWFASIQAAIGGEIQRLTEKLASRIRELEERYAWPLPDIEDAVADLGEKVEDHLKKMGLVWG